MGSLTHFPSNLGASDCLGYMKTVVMSTLVTTVSAIMPSLVADVQ